MKRQIPLMLVLVGGLFMIFQYFVPHEKSEWAYEFLLDWILVIGIFALALGIWSLFQVSVEKIKAREENWAYKYVTIVGLVVMVIFGFTSKTGDAWGWYFAFVATATLTILLLIQAIIARSNKGLYLGLFGLFLISSVLIALFDSAWQFHFYTAEGLQNQMFRNFFNHVMMPVLATMFSLLAFFIASAAYRAFRARSVLASLLLIAALIVMLRFNPYLQPIFGDYMAKTSNWLMNVPNLAAQRAIVVGIGLGIVATALKVILGIERGYMGKG